jgi:hypothetical protein
MTSSDSVASGLDWVPDACTLPTAEQPLRLGEFDDLFATAVDNSQRLSRQHLRLTLTGPADLQTTVQDLASRENECCSFFAFTVVSDAPGRVVFDIEVPVAHVDVLDALADRASRVRSAR